jgi:hypothetical protein
MEGIEKINKPCSQIFSIQILDCRNWVLCNPLFRMGATIWAGYNFGKSCDNIGPLTFLVVAKTL